MINGFLSPEEKVIKVKVSKTISVFDQPLQIDPVDFENTLLIKDAVVTIKNENQEEVALTYSDVNKLYEISSDTFLIAPGKSYTLNVVAVGKEFKAVCTIPDQKVERITAVMGTKIHEDNLRENLNIRFDDIKGDSNFYIVGALFKATDSTEENPAISNFGTERFATDVNGDGVVISADGTIIDIKKTQEVTVKIANVDELIYTALKASFLNEKQTEDPFFQPIIAPSNIQGEGGYGVFAGFRLVEKKLILDPVNP